MIIETKYFGKLEINDEKIVEFENGIFGFEESKKFVVLYENNDKKNIFAWLQAVDEKEVSIPLINPMIWFENYEPDIDDELLESIGELKIENISIYSVVVVPENIKDMTTNLKAPIIINRVTKKGIQVIANNEELQIKTNLYETLQKEEI